MYTMEYYLVIKNDTLPLLAKSVELEDIMLGLISKAQEDMHHVFSLTCGCQKTGL